MQLPKDALVAVVDGEKLHLFQNSGDEASPKLHAVQAGKVDDSHKSSGGHHGSSAANPDDKQQDEDGFAAGVAEMLNAQALSNKFDHLIVIAAPRTLGELRKHYHKSLSAKLTGEIAKELTGADAAAIEKAIAAE